MMRVEDLTRRLVLLVAVAMGLLAAGCGAGSAPVPSVDVVVVGHSPSDASQARLFGGELHGILGRARARHGRVLAGVIAAENSTTWPVDVTFDAGGGNAFGRQRRDRAAQAQAERRAQQLLAEPAPPGSSDIVASQVAAAQLFAQLRGDGGSTLTLWVLSDGHQVGDGLNLYTADLSALGIERQIAASTEAGTIPNLRGVEVRFAGAGLDRRRIDLAREAGIKRFWAAWVRATGGRLAAYAGHDVSR
jgi:hypothetical protein